MGRYWCRHVRENGVMTKVVIRKAEGDKRPVTINGVKSRIWLERRDCLNGDKWQILYDAGLAYPNILSTAWSLDRAADKIRHFHDALTEDAP